MQPFKILVYMLVGLGLLPPAGYSAEADNFRWSWEMPQPGTNAPAGAATIERVSYEALVAENLRLRRELERMAQQQGLLQEEGAALRLQVQELDGRRAALAASLREFKIPEEVTNEIVRLRNALTQREREGERLRQQLYNATSIIPAEVRAPLSSSQLYKRMERENMDLRAEIAELQNRCAMALEAGKQMESKALADTARWEELRQTNAVLLARIRELAERPAPPPREEKGAVPTKPPFVPVEATNTNGTRQAAVQTQLSQTNKVKDTDIIQDVLATSSPPPGKAPASKTESTFQSALRAARAGKYREAEKLYLKALAESPANATIHFNLGVLYDEELKDSAKAAFHYRKYLDLRPEASDAQTVRAWLMEIRMGIR